MTDDTDVDITSLRAAIEKADGLIAHYHRGITLAQDLKRVLVLRMLHKQFPNLSVHDQEKLMLGYGLKP